MFKETNTGASTIRRVIQYVCICLHGALVFGIGNQDAFDHPGTGFDMLTYKLKLASSANLHTVHK